MSACQLSPARQVYRSTFHHLCNHQSKVNFLPNDSLVVSKPLCVMHRKPSCCGLSVIAYHHLAIMDALAELSLSLCEASLAICQNKASLGRHLQVHMDANNCTPVTGYPSREIVFVHRFSLGQHLLVYKLKLGAPLQRCR